LPTWTRTTGATTNALVKATAANTLGDSGLINVSGGAITTGNDTAVSITAGAVSAGTTGKDVSLTASAAKAGSNANGGSVNFTPGAGDGVGNPGEVLVTGVFRATLNSVFNQSIQCYNSTTAIGNGGAYISGSGADQYFFASGATYASGIDTGLKRAAAGVVTVTDGSTGQGAFFAKSVITAKTADYTVTAAETGTIFTNTGSSGTVVFTLPASPANGLTYEFHITAANSVDIKTGTAVLIYANAVATTATTGKLTKNTVGTTIRLTYNGVAWMGPGQSGTWTVS
jgi:hypothetical protein